MWKSILKWLAQQLIEDIAQQLAAKAAQQEAGTLPNPFQK